MMLNCMRKLFPVSVFLAVLFSTAIAQAQQSQLDSIRRKFKDYRDVTFQEKLFVHVDQNFYLTGEILWLRIFSVDGVVHRPSTMSKVAFVELLDRSGSPVVQTKIQLGEHGGQGSVFIPATLASGNYTLRVYTQWMRNFSPDYYFHKEVTVVNPFVRPDNLMVANAAKTTVEFFPEGGNLVSGVKTRVGFKISNTLGESMSGNGFVIRNSTDTVATFSPLKFGLGSFYFTPAPNEEYKCTFVDESGNSSSHPLPKVNGNGYAMHLSDSGANLLKIRVNLAGVDKSSLTYTYLFVHARQSIALAEAKPIYPNEAVYVIPKGNLPEGISHFTVFDDQQRPVCERLYFKAPVNPLTLGLSTDQTSYTTRRKVSLNVTSAANSSAVPADVSLSVFRLDSLSSGNREDILAYLYLQSDLKGTIESPEYYFSKDADAAAAADNLMLTHGWRRFSWENILKRKTEIRFIPEVRSHLITGKVSKSDGSPVPGVLTYLSSPGKLVNVYGARSNEDGLVHFEVRDFWGPRRLIFQTDTSQDSTYNLSINNPYDESKSPAPIKPFVLPAALEEKLSARSLSMQVQDIYYREVNDRVVAVKNDSTGFFGQPDETYNLDDYTRFPVMEEVMREYVPGVLVRKRRSGFHFLVVDRLNKGILNGDPLVLLDGMPVFDVDQIMAFDPLKIKKLEVVTRNFYVGPLRLPGIVSYSTYTGDLAGFTMDPRSIVINYEGLQSQREFYSPRYDSQKEKSSRLPDQRTLLHWVPSIRTNEDGKATVDFYTSDTTGEFMIVAHGLGMNGKAATAVQKFVVKRNDF
jgi:hypothetical protein